MRLRELDKVGFKVAKLKENWVKREAKYIRTEIIALLWILPNKEKSGRQSGIDHT